MGSNNKSINRKVKKYSNNKKISRWLIAAIIDWLIIIVAIIIALQMNNVVVYFIVIFIVGTRQHALTQLGHDGAHYLVSDNYKLNDFLTNLFCFWPLMIGLSGYRNFHFQHHRYMGTKLDPELKEKKLEKPQWDVPMKINRMKKYFLEDLIGLHFRNVLHLFKEIKHKNKVNIMGTIIIWIIILIVLYFTNLLGALIIWFVSLFTSFWAVFRVRAYHEHLGTRR